MAKHKVKQGECISSISDDYGFFWDTIWNLPENGELKRKRTDPNVLFPGDEVFIPDKREKTEVCTTEQRHRFRRKGVPEHLRIVVKDEDGEPLQNTSYLLTIDGEHRQGVTDSDGLIDESISPNAMKGKLTVGDWEDAEEYELALGDLDPITEITGVQSRLSNLGFKCGPADGHFGPRTRSALEAFQRKYNLDVNGELNDATREKLVEVYDTSE